MRYRQPFFTGILILICYFSYSQAQIVEYRNIIDGHWDSAKIWQKREEGGEWEAATSAPGGGENITILQNVTCNDLYFSGRIQVYANIYGTYRVSGGSFAVYNNAGLNGTFENSGTINIHSAYKIDHCINYGTVNMIGSVGLAGGLIDNYGVINDIAEADKINYCVYNNYNIFRKSGPGSLNHQAIINNEGWVDITTGKLMLSPGGIDNKSTGKISVGTGTVLEIGSLGNLMLRNGSTIGGGGRVDVYNGMDVYTPNLHWPSGLRLRLINGAIGGSGSIRMDASMSMIGDFTRVYVPLTILPTAKLELENARVGDNLIENYGQVQWVSGNVVVYSYPFKNYGLFYITAGQREWFVQSTYFGTQFENYGTFKQNTNGPTSINAVFLNKSGGIISGSGGLRFRNFSSEGNLSPGSSPGRSFFTLEEGQLLTDKSSVEIEIVSSAGPGVGHDLVETNTDLVLNGKLVVEDGGSAPLGSYTIIQTNGQISGVFDEVILPPGYSIAYNDQSVVVTKTSGAVPAGDECKSPVLKLDGVDDYIITHFKDPLTSAFTVAADFKLSDYPASDRQYVVASKSSFFALTHADFPVRVTIGPDGKMYATFSDDKDFSNEALLTGLNAISLNVWHTVAVTYAANNKIALYLDGVLQQELPISFTISSNTQPWTFGRDAAEYAGGTGLGFFKGQIAHATLWDKALTAAELLSWNCKVVDETTLADNHFKFYYPLTEGEGPIVYDKKSGNFGSLSGPTWISDPSNCRGGIVTPTWYRDADGDGFGDEENTQTTCVRPEGYVDEPGDCNDNNSKVYPGATEVCDGIDNDCDGVTDEGFTAGTMYYQDLDGDGFGNPAISQTSCTVLQGFVTNNPDCNDDNPNIYPGATEVCDGLDNDCDGSTDEGVALQTWYQDSDGDGYGNGMNSTMSCNHPDGYVLSAGDCNDNNPAIHPGATELCDGIDSDCDGSVDENANMKSWYLDNDRDGYGSNAQSIISCNQPAGYVLQNGDCNDANSAINPAAIEVCDDLDNDCDGSVDEGLSISNWYRDADNDGYGNLASVISSCKQPTGYVANSSDCNDNDATIHPTAIEVCDAKDNNCDGQIDEGCTAGKLPTISIAPWGISVEGRGAKAEFYITVSKPVNKQISVRWKTTNGSAQSTADFTAENAIAYITPNTNAVKISVNLQDDNVYEGLESFAIVLSEPVNASVRGATATGIIVDNDTPPLLKLYDTVTSENKLKAVIRAQLTNTAAMPVVFSYLTTSGTAKAGADFEARIGTIRFDPGERTKYIEVPVMWDKVNEGAEKFTVSALNLVNLLQGLQQATVTIQNSSSQSNTVSTSKPGTTSTVSTFEVTVSPNPSSAAFTFNLKSSSEESLTLKLFDETGRLLRVITGISANGTKRIGDELRPGVYIGELRQGQHVKVVKLLKINR